MIPYKNISGKSGVVAYKTGKTFIKIKFAGESIIYTYNSKKPGKFFVEKMKELALKGKGLSTFISQNIRNNYAKKGN